MKILHVVTSLFATGGGTSEVVPRMCEALVAAGHEVRIVTGGGLEPSEAAKRAGEAGVDVRYCPMRLASYLGFWRVTPAFLRELVASVKWADIVHVHGHWQDTSWIVPKIACKLRKPYVMQPHGFLEPERLKKSALQKRIVGSLFERPNLNRAAAVIATAESEKWGIEQYGVKSPIKVVPIGIETKAIDVAPRNKELLAKWGLDPAKKTLLYFSRFTPIKGLDLLAEAWAQLKEFHADWQLFIAGPDDRGYAAEIQKFYGRTITDGSVIFSGPIYGEEKNVLLKSVDAFVLPTRSENFSIAVQEALAAGLPVVCTKGAPWKAIAEEGAGEWVDVSADAIREGLRRILSADEVSRLKMGEVGVRLISRGFKWSSVTSVLEKVYQGVRRRG